MKKTIFKNNGFTLIELLVVVLIIGILAAIALPKYQTAVVKSAYSTLKFKTKAIAEAMNRYMLATDQLPPQGFLDLDIDLPDTTSITATNTYFANGGGCQLWLDGSKMTACFYKDFKMGYYFRYQTLKPLLCYTKKNYDVGNKVCQQETGKTTGNCQNDYCTYAY